MTNANHARCQTEPSRRHWLTQAVACGAGAALASVSATAMAAGGEAGAVVDLSVKAFGAKGDGVADDTAAIQAALDAAAKAGGGHVHFPAGRYRVVRTLVLASADRLDLTGAGASSVLLHESDEPLLLWPEHVACRESSVRHLVFESVKQDKSPATAVFDFRGGAERTLFSHLFFKSNGATIGSGVSVQKVMDTVTFDQCLIWGPMRGTGIRVCRGSAVLVFGGRIIGNDPYKGVIGSSIGIHLTTDNGGVHVVGTDIIGLGTGMKIGEVGQTSNREVFLTHTTFDSCVHGLVQVDHAYTSITGCWSASCDEEQILLDHTAEGAILSIAGGTIFNGGAYGRPGGHNGLVVHQGTFTMAGVNVRHNKGHGILIGPSVRDYAINGCRITDNGTGAILDGSGYVFQGNVLARNGKSLVVNGAANAQQLGNVNP